MSVPDTILDKLRNYEYEKCGCEGAVGDIYALIHHIAVLEEEIDDLKASAGINDGGCASRGASDGVIAVDILGRPWVAREGGWWRLMKDVIAGKWSELPQQYAPYSIVHVPAYTPKEES
jgi:hypothetical protein|uniref:Uncharacterized protein n=1 Tax=Siphoviridae sp. ctksc2 TaxID=2825645 RepID=A0A8S5US59_9CAUD|nr:MAG TPA: hypothetical protein [Siphoviridae sp. ctksc2]